MVKNALRGLVVCLSLWEGGAALALPLPLPLPTPTLPPFPIFDAPPTEVTPALAAIPGDVKGVRDQLDFDIFAWRELIALNWPADPATCAARADVSILDPGPAPRVWETWKTDAEVFVADPTRAQPAAWCQQQSPAGRTFFTVSPFFTIQQAFGGPLVDQGGRFVRYEERVNRDEHEFILARGLWSQAGQTRWLAHDPIDMPAGDATHAGAIEVKAAWKVLTPAERLAGRFYAVRAVISTGRDSAGRPLTAVADLGLIGFHITHKSRSSPQWSWATFEHLDNLTSSLRAPACRARVACTVAASFYCPDGCCPDNCQTTTCTDGVCPELTAAGRPVHLPVQVSRVQDVAAMALPDREVTRVNAAFQRLLAGSVWANYALVSTQWPSRPDVAGGVPAPPFLANVALETYNQGGTTAGSDGAAAYPSAGYAPFAATVSSSCLKCHATAVTAGTNRAGHRAPADFSFLLGKAR
jgi:hypothetical protein